MRKIIAIGESVLDTVFKGNTPVKAMVGGRIANAAATLGMLQLPVTMCSECGTDSVGDIIVDFLQRHQVSTQSVDRFTDGATALAAIFKGENGHDDKIVNYGRYPVDRFDVVWPRIDENDIVLFGSLYAIDSPQREHLFELVQYARERKALIVYLPGFQHGINFRITRVMTAILENLEISDIVIAHERDINNIFPGESAAEAYRNHIEFYCPTYLHINPDLSVTMFAGKQRREYAAATPATSNLLGWQAGFTAGIIYELMCRGLRRDQLIELEPQVAAAVLASAQDFAAQCASAPDNCLPPGYAASRVAAYASRADEREKNMAK